MTRVRLESRSYDQGRRKKKRPYPFGHAAVCYCSTRVLLHAKVLKETATEGITGSFVTFLYHW